MRAGRALREQWAADARADARARNPRLAAEHAADLARHARRDRVLERYGRLLRAAMARGELDAEQVIARYSEARDRTARELTRQTFAAHERTTRESVR